MTTVPGIRSVVEANLAEQLSAFAREFVADLEAQGRLVEAGGAGVLERLRTQVEAVHCPEAYHAAVDTIVEDCGYPSEVAMRIATALNRKGLIPGDDVEPRHGRAPSTAPDDEAGPPAADVEPGDDVKRASLPVVRGRTPGGDVEPRHDAVPASVPDARGRISGGDVEPRHDRTSSAVPDGKGLVLGGDVEPRREAVRASLPDVRDLISGGDVEFRRDAGPASVPDVRGWISGGDLEPRHDHASAPAPDSAEQGPAGGFEPRHDRVPAPGPDGEETAAGGEESEPRHDRAPASVPDHAGPVPGGEDTEPRHDRTALASPLVPPARGAIVLHLAARGAGRGTADHGAAPVPQRVDGQVPRVRPAAARSRTVGWGSASARAVSVAASLQSDHLARLEAMQIMADGERVTVAIKATCLDDWEYWLDAIGAPRNVRTRTAGHAQVAAGTLDGVAVHLTAHGVPELLQEASDTAADPFFLWGRIYDLGMGQVDRTDRIWLSLGRRQDERGMPLLVLRGTDGPPYPLASIVMAHGPLTATPLPSGGITGDSA
ncbi:BN159_2729 family protein [Streptomyces sp. NPDC001914]|uniref:BN159_2729 family protein n=1 Tax=Streptomyces sp. NPDC001914 TaxID=3364623 RepID=UPI00367CAA32